MNQLFKNLIDDWGLANMSPDQQNNIIEHVGSLVYQQVIIRARELLTPIEQEEFDLLLEEETSAPVHILLFLEQKISTFQDLLKDEVAKIKSKVLK